MLQSMFLTFVTRWFPSIVLSIVEKLNDTKGDLVYLHRRMLKKEYSDTGKWDSLSAANTNVMADVVAMDTELPLKSRDSIGKASGDIPKMGMEMKLNETELTALDNLVRRQGMESVILQKLFQDTPKVIKGVYERNEALFLQGLSTGIMVLDDDKNVGTGIRIDFQYPVGNKFGVATLWSSTSATPMDDFDRMLAKAKANGDRITRVMMDDTAFNNMRKTTQFKERYAFSVNYSGTTTIIPDRDKTMAFLLSEYKFTVEIVDRSVRYEKNGVQTSYRPWADGAVVGLTADQVGSLVYATLAEENHPVANVNYSKADDMILVSKYSLNKPSLTEATSSQARVVPVISGVDQIYLIDSTTVQG